MRLRRAVNCLTVTAVVISLACIGAIAWMISKGVMVKPFVHPKQDCMSGDPKYDSLIRDAEEKSWPTFCADGQPTDDACEESRKSDNGTDTDEGKVVQIKCKCCDADDIAGDGAAVDQDFLELSNPKLLAAICGAVLFCLVIGLCVVKSHQRTLMLHEERDEQQFRREYDTSPRARPRPPRDDRQISFADGTGHAPNLPSTRAMISARKDGKGRTMNCLPDSHFYSALARAQGIKLTDRNKPDMDTMVRVPDTKFFEQYASARKSRK